MVKTDHYSKGCSNDCQRFEELSLQLEGDLQLRTHKLDGKHFENLH